MKKLILVALLLAGCSDTFDDLDSEVRNYFVSHPYGDSPDYRLYKRSYLGDSFIGVVFGYADDESGCRDIANLLNENRVEGGTYSYFCRPMK